MRQDWQVEPVCVLYANLRGLGYYFEDKWAEEIGNKMKNFKSGSRGEEAICILTSLPSYYTL